MYNFLLILHNFLRWIVVIAAAISVVRAFRGWRGSQPWTTADDRAGLIFTSAMDLQLLIGLLLMFVFSPVTKAAFSDMGSAMSDAVLRFFVAEHLPIMIIAIIIAHIGRARTKKIADDVLKHRTAFTLFGMTALLLLMAIPWPFIADYGRPWLRF